MSVWDDPHAERSERTEEGEVYTVAVRRQGGAWAQTEIAVRLRDRPWHHTRAVVDLAANPNPDYRIRATRALLREVGSRARGM